MWHKGLGRKMKLRQVRDVIRRGLIQLDANRRTFVDVKPDSELKTTAEALLGVNDALRQEAMEQKQKIDSIERFIELSAMEWGPLFWRQYSLCMHLFGPPNPCNVPPRKIPDELMDGFTMGGTIPIEYNYLDTTYPDNWPLIYTDYQIDLYLEKIGKRQTHIYGMTDVWMWEAIEKYPIKGLHVVNIGSVTPWYESNCLYYGAKSTTIDYNKIITRTDRLKTMTTVDWDREQPVFDIAWSISSFEHDGLGMYGDPLDPEGDLKAMRNMKRVVKPSGLMFLSVPIGNDKLVFNNARIYGRKRLPLMMEGWELIDTFGLEPIHYEGPGHIQPVFILRNL